MMLLALRLYLPALGSDFIVIGSVQCISLGQWSRRHTHHCCQPATLAHFHCVERKLAAKGLHGEINRAQLCGIDNKVTCGWRIPDFAPTLELHPTTRGSVNLGDLLGVDIGWLACPANIRPHSPIHLDGTAHDVEGLPNIILMEHREGLPLFKGKARGRGHR